MWRRSLLIDDGVLTGYSVTRYSSNSINCYAVVILVLFGFETVSLRSVSRSAVEGVLLYAQLTKINDPSLLGPGKKSRFFR